MPPQFKFASVLVIWAVVAIVLLSTLPDIGFLGIVLVGGATAVTLSIFEGEKNEKSAGAVNAHSVSKAKRDENNLSEMLALLDEDDAYEVRQRIKQRLFDQIDGGALDNVESFEELLGSAERKKRG